MRVIMIEDHELLAQSLQLTLKAEDVDVVRVWSSDRQDLLTQAAAQAPGVLLLDFDLGDDIGVSFGLIEPLRAAGLDVVMLTGERNPLVLAQCLEEGAVGIINKSVSFDELVSQVHRAVRGEDLMTRHEREELLSQMRLHRAERDQQLRPFQDLTAREAEVLGELMQGKAADTIAEESVVSVATIRTQIRSILGKLGVNSQLAAVARAQQARWEPPDSA